MNIIRYSDFSTAIRYTLGTRSARDGDVEIVLRLFRRAVPASTTTLASVAPDDAASVLSRCRRHIERLGIRPLGNVPPEIPPEPKPDREHDPRHALPAAAFDWMFEAG